MFFIVVLVIGSFGQLIAETRICTKKDYCIPVPAEVCDKSRCLPFDWDEMAVFGDVGIKFNTWNIAQKAFVGYCPPKYKLEQSTAYDGKTLEKFVVATNSGPYCNITAGTTIRSFIAEPDPYNGKYCSMEINKAGDLYDSCFIYLEPGVGYVYRACRVDPPPEQGRACAAVFVIEMATGTYNKENLKNYIQGLGIDFPKLVVDCSDPIK